MRTISNLLFRTTMLAKRSACLDFLPALAAIHLTFIFFGFGFVSQHFHPDKVV